VSKTPITSTEKVKDNRNFATFKGAGLVKNFFVGPGKSFTGWQMNNLVCSQFLGPVERDEYNHYSCSNK
jgi:hypothetical protein